MPFRYWLQTLLLSVGVLGGTLVSLYCLIRSNDDATLYWQSIPWFAFICSSLFFWTFACLAIDRLAFMHAPSLPSSFIRGTLLITCVLSGLAGGMILSMSFIIPSPHAIPLTKLLWVIVPAGLWSLIVPNLFFAKRVVPKDTIVLRADRILLPGERYTNRPLLPQPETYCTPTRWLEWRILKPRFSDGTFAIQVKAVIQVMEDSVPMEMIKCGLHADAITDFIVREVTRSAEQSTFGAFLSQSHGIMLWQDGESGLEASVRITQVLPVTR